MAQTARINLASAEVLAALNGALWFFEFPLQLAVQPSVTRKPFTSLAIAQGQYRTTDLAAVQYLP
jgi:hypothetical protein